LILPLAFLFIGCQARETSEAPAPATTTESSTTASTPAAAPYDLQFLDTMSKHHQMALDMIKMAGDKFAHKELKQATQKMMADQQKEIDQMKQWRVQWYPGAPPAENMDMPGMASSMNMDMSQMQSMSGKQLDLMFIDMMIPHHQGAVDMSKDAPMKAEHQEIKDLAQRIIDSQQKEIDQMKQWKENWSKQK
jgi:uncharacterized protein (DUF305 family)